MSSGKMSNQDYVESIMVVLQDLSNQDGYYFWELDADTVDIGLILKLLKYERWPSCPAVIKDMYTEWRYVHNVWKAYLTNQRSRTLSKILRILSFTIKYWEANNKYGGDIEIAFFSYCKEKVTYTIKRSWIEATQINVHTWESRKLTANDLSPEAMQKAIESTIIWLFPKAQEKLYKKVLT